VMAIMGVAPTVMKPTALVLNILVACIATVQFARQGYFSWRLFLPFAAMSIPAAFLGGKITLPPEYYKPAVGVVLLCAAVRMLVTAAKTKEGDVHPPPMWAALVAGAGLGFLAGLTGTGGGIFLSPLLLIAGWAEPKQTSSVSAAFILVNSISGLLGAWKSVQLLPPQIALWAVAAVAGGLVGSYYGSTKVPNPWLRRLLAAVLVIAGSKLVMQV